MEMANAYTELNDPLLQQDLFQVEVEKGLRGDSEVHPNNRVRRGAALRHAPDWAPRRRD